MQWPACFVINITWGMESQSLTLQLSSLSHAISPANVVKRCVHTGPTIFVTVACITRPRLLINLAQFSRLSLLWWRHSTNPSEFPFAWRHSFLIFFLFVLVHCLVSLYQVESRFWKSSWFRASGGIVCLCFHGFSSCHRLWLPNSIEQKVTDREITLTWNFSSQAMSNFSLWWFFDCFHWLNMYKDVAQKTQF